MGYYFTMARMRGCSKSKVLNSNWKMSVYQKVLIMFHYAKMLLKTRDETILLSGN